MGDPWVSLRRAFSSAVNFPTSLFGAPPPIHRSDSPRRTVKSEFHPLVAVKSTTQFSPGGSLDNALRYHSVSPPGGATLSVNNWPACSKVRARFQGGLVNGQLPLRLTVRAMRAMVENEIVPPISRWRIRGEIRTMSDPANRDASCLGTVRSMMDDGG